ncbi:MAG: hypothetical protein IJD43_15810 [Thermoguttaceae bacterium]|nr:hypothetical protein [Thermoguttaceae bacterium]
MAGDRLERNAAGAAKLISVMPPEIISCSERLCTKETKCGNMRCDDMILMINFAKWRAEVHKTPVRKNESTDF